MSRKPRDEATPRSTQLLRGDPDESAEAAQDDTDTAPSPDLEEVELLKPHNHDGVDYPVGHRLTVTAGIATWLRQFEVIA